MDSKIDHPGTLQLSETRFEPSGLTLAVGGELDVATAPVLRDRLCAAREFGVDRAIIDIRAVTFMDSIALAAIVNIAKQLEGRIAVVVDPESYAMLILEVSGLPAALNIVESVEAAHAQLGSSVSA